MLPRPLLSAPLHGSLPHPEHLRLSLRTMMSIAGTRNGTRAGSLHIWIGGAGLPRVHDGFCVIIQYNLMGEDSFLLGLIRDITAVLASRRVGRGDAGIIQSYSL